MDAATARAIVRELDLEQTVAALVDAAPPLTEASSALVARIFDEGAVRRGALSKA